MAFEVEVIGKKYYSRMGGVAQEIPVGTRLVLRHKPSDRETKLKLVKEADDVKLIVNDSPEAARLRDEGKEQAADKVLADSKDNLAKKDAKKKRQTDEPKIPKPTVEK